MCRGPEARCVGTEARCAGTLRPGVSGPRGQHQAPTYTMGQSDDLVGALTAASASRPLTGSWVGVAGQGVPWPHQQHLCQPAGTAGLGVAPLPGLLFHLVTE